MKQKYEGRVVIGPGEGGCYVPTSIRGHFVRAPERPGTYILYELFDNDGMHAGWKWEVSK